MESAYDCGRAKKKKKKKNKEPINITDRKLVIYACKIKENNVLNENWVDQNKTVDRLSY